MWGVELVKDKSSRLAFDPKLKVGEELSAICFRRGLNTRPLGGHTMAFTPPLIISDAEIDGTEPAGICCYRAAQD